MYNNNNNNDTFYHAVGKKSKMLGEKVHFVDVFKTGIESTVTKVPGMASQ